MQSMNISAYSEGFTPIQPVSKPIIKGEHLITGQYPTEVPTNEHSSGTATGETLPLQR